MTSPNKTETTISQAEWFRQAVAHPRESFFVDVENCRIHYQRWVQTNNAEKKPVLLFVHGGGAHSHWWDFIAPAFVDDYEVLAIDLGGMGESEHRELYSDSLYAKELVAVCEHAGYKKDISIISHSYGGRSVLTLALQNPELLRSIIITDCTLISPAEHAEMQGRKDVPPSPFGQKKVYPSKEAGLERFKLMPPQECLNQYLVDYVAENSIGPVEGGWSWKFDMDFIDKRDESYTNNPLIDMIHEIKCPIANFYGENSILFPPNIVDMYKEKYPSQTKFYCLPDAQHHLLLDQPEAFIEMLKRIQLDLGTDKLTPANSTETYRPTLSD